MGILAARRNRNNPDFVNSRTKFEKKRETAVILSGPDARFARVRPARDAHYAHYARSPRLASSLSSFAPPLRSVRGLRSLRSLVSLRSKNFARPLFTLVNVSRAGEEPRLRSGCCIRVLILFLSLRLGLVTESLYSPPLLAYAQA